MNDYTAESLRQKRLELGLTQGEMAKRLGVSRSVYSQRECGACPITDKFARRIESLEQDCSNYEQPVDNFVDKLEQPDGVGELVLAPVQVLETVQQNNEMIQNVEQTLGSVDETLTGLAKSLRFLEDFDKAVQRRVKEVIEERSRHIIAACNMHVTAQAQIIITALTAVITVLESGNASNSVAITLLERVRAQIAKLSGVPEESV
jgi:transcriptional regulator with XRE-family HTH domain